MYMYSISLKDFGIVEVDSAENKKLNLQTE